MSVINFGQKLSSKDNREYFVTSDLHFFHKNIMKVCKDTRPFANVDDMNEYLIEFWNKSVKEDDVIFHLGDFSFKAKEATKGIIEQLNGNIVWVKGNHDHKVFNQLGIKAYDYLEVKYDGTKVCMMHYPISCWSQQGRGSVCLHGHTHGSYQGKGRIVDVGWDNWGNIMKLSSLVKFCLGREIYCPDYHKIV